MASDDGAPTDLIDHDPTPRMDSLREALRTNPGAVADKLLELADRQAALEARFETLLGAIGARRDPPDPPDLPDPSRAYKP